MEEFKNLFSSKKTIQMELKPIGNTQLLIDNYKNNKEHKNKGYSISYDAIRYKQMPTIKKILDDWHRSIINKWLGVSNITHTDISNAYDYYLKLKDKELTSKEYIDTIIQPLAKKMTSNLALISSVNIPKLSYTKLFDGVIQEFIVNNSDYKGNKEEYYNIAESYKGYAGYFDNYKKSRINLYTPELKANSICYRLFMDNMVNFFDNYILLKKIKENYADLYSEISELEQYFVPEMYTLCFTQEQIDKYNYIIGHSNEENDEKCLNMIISEYKQKNRLSNKDLPLMTKLKKQILSEAESSVKIFEIKDNEELVEITKKTYETSKSISVKLSELMVKNFTCELASDYIVDKKNFTDISYSVFNNWQFLNNAINSHIQSLTKKLQTLQKKEQKALKKEIETFEKKQSFSLEEINSLMREYITIEDIEEFSSYSVKDIYNFFRFKADELLREVETNWLSTQKELKNFNKKNIDKLKTFYDSTLELNRVYKTLLNDDITNEVAKELRVILEEYREVIKNYNLCRNYITKKPYSKEKFPLSFGSSYFGNGWDSDKVSERLCNILKKDGLYYVGIVDISSNESRKCLDNLPECTSDNKYYEIMYYKQLTDSYKQLPRALFAKTNKDLVKPSLRLYQIRDGKLYTKSANDKEALTEWINACKNLLENHPSWKNYTFTFKNSEDYTDVNDFYTDVDNQAFILKFKKVSADKIDTLVEQRSLYLFQIYSNDFTECNLKKENNNDSIYTRYLKSLFSEENIENIKNGKPYNKLNGGFKVFYREASIPLVETHPANIPIENKNPNKENKIALYKYSIYKDKRFASDKIICHMACTFNSGTKTSCNTIKAINQMTNKKILENKGTNVLSVMRTSKNLLYYVVVNPKGEILEKGSLDKINNFDYDKLIKRKLNEYIENNRNWKTLGSIDSIKEGYLDVAIGEIIRIRDKYNAVISIEDVRYSNNNKGINKKIYGSFEFKLLNKLSYCCSKHENAYGTFDTPIQLAYPINALNDVFFQNGHIFLMNTAYLTMCPSTNFLFHFYSDLVYKNREKAITTLNSFSKFGFDEELKKIVVEFTYKDLGSSVEDDSYWTLELGGEWNVYNSTLKKYEKRDLTEELLFILSESSIDYTDKQYKFDDISVNNLKNLFEILRLCFKMQDLENETICFRNTILKKNKEVVAPMIISDIERKAYNLALKTLFSLSNISEEYIVSINYDEYFKKYINWLSNFK